MKNYKVQTALFTIMVFCFIQMANTSVMAQTQIGQDIDGEAAGDQFGISNSMPNDTTIAIGAADNGGNGLRSGHVRVYRLINSNWIQQGSDIDGEAAGDLSGFSISMPDNFTVGIGAHDNDGNGNSSGHVRIYRWNGSSWIQKGADIDGEAADDQSGFSISMPDSNTVAIGAPYNDGGGSNSGHVRIYKWNGSTWIQKGADIDGETADDWSGYSVSMPDSNTVAIGVPADNSFTGQVRIYHWNGTVWIQKGTDIDGEAVNDVSGYSVSMPDAITIAIGARSNSGNGLKSGHVRIYHWNGTAWIQKGADIDGEAADDQSGVSVCMPDAHTVAIGAFYNDGNGLSSGHVKVYHWDGTAWMQRGTDIDGEAADDQSSRSVSMPNANTVAIGAVGNDGNGSNSGHVRIYNIPPAPIVIPTTIQQIGQDIDGEAAGDQSGESVSMPDAKTIAIGARSNNGNGAFAGHVRVYHFNDTNWIQKGADIDGEATHDRSGQSVSMPDANTVAIGANHNDGNGLSSGHVRIYRWNGTAWIQKGADIDGEAASDQSGYSLSMPDSNTVVIGASSNDGNGSSSGHVRIYKWNGTAWIQRGADIDGEAASDQSGYSLSMPDSNTVAIGARSNDGNGSNSGHVRIYQWNGSVWIQKGADIDGEVAGDRSGNSVSMPNSNTVAIGATSNDDNGSNSGHVRIYHWNGTAWVQKGGDIDGEAASDFSGHSVSMPDAHTVAISAIHDDGNGSSSGNVRIYHWNGTAWAQRGIGIDGEAASDFSGYSVSMPDANTIAIGAQGNDGNGSSSGHVRIFRLSPVPLSAAITVQNHVNCSGAATGSITAQAIDGKPNYSYSWSNSSSTSNTASTTNTISGLVAGIYTVTITDSDGTTAISSDTITEPASTSIINISSSDANCFGANTGSITAAATGGTPPYLYSWSSGDTSATAFNLVAGMYSVTATDFNGCFSSRDSITINEPTSIGVSVTSLTNAACNGGNTGSATVTATGGTSPYTYSWSNGDTSATAFNLVAGSYSVTATDFNGCFFTRDTINIAEPTAFYISLTAKTNVACNGGNTGSATVTATGGTSPYTYSWSNGDTSATAFNLVAGSYSVTATDNNGCLFTRDTIIINEPIAIGVSVTSLTNAACNGGNTGSAAAAATGGTPPYLYSWSNGDTSSTAFNLVAGMYSVTATDNNGCFNTKDSITIAEPSVLSTTIVIDSNETCGGLANGGLTVSATGGTSQYTYLWSNGVTTSTITGITAGTYTVTVNDANGCTSIDSLTIIIADTIKPTVIAQNINAYLDATANVAITTAEVNNGSSDACGVSSMALSKSSFSCSEVGANTVQLIVTDVNGNIDSTSSIVTVVDSIKPTVLAQNISIYLDANGAASITAAAIDNGSTDNCGTVTLTVDSSNFDCSEVGANTVTLYATDANNNVDSTTATVTVLDTVRPDVITQNIDLYLDVNGAASISTADIDNGSIDNCSTVSLALDSTNFDCNEVGVNTVILYVTDANNNLDSASAMVTVIDTVRPDVITQNIDLYLDASGNATITTADFDNGSNDACGGLVLSIDSTAFDCSEEGTNTVWLTATDANNNVDSASAIVTVLDTVRPDVITQNINLYLDANGEATITTADIDNGSNDACGGLVLSLDSTTFDCSEEGTNTVWLTATDGNNNVDSASATVTVIDTINPTVITQNIDLYLDANGEANIATADIDNSSTDACGALVLSLDSTNFDCSEVGVNTVTLYGTDVNGNLDSTTATVTIIDTIRPTMIAQNIDLYLDANGEANITAADIDNGSSDNCGTVTLTLDSSNYDCSEVGVNTVTLYATDANNNVDSTTATVSVLDTLNPTLISQNVSIYLDANGVANITTADIDNGSNDNCGTVTLALDSSNYDCSEVGVNTVTLYATDANNNVDSTTATVTVLDTLNPTLISQNVSIYLDANGVANITTADIDNGSNDNCGTVTLALDSSNYDCSEVGVNTVTLYATDANNNIDSTTATVTVLDTINPMISSCPANIAANIDAGNCTAVVSWTAPTSADNCRVDSLISSHKPGDVFALGTTTVTYIAYDPELNTDTCSFTVTVTDDEDPVIANVPANITVNNDNGECGAIVTWNAITASDNCTLDSLRSTANSGDNFPIGTTTVTYTAYDANTNTSTVSFTVTVNDSELPTIVCPSDIAQCDSFVNWNTVTGVDNCPNAVTVRTDVSKLFPGDQFPVGITSISYEVTDASNNQETCSFEVEVYAPANANAGPDLTTRDIEPIQIDATAINAATINWTPFFSLSDAHAEKPFANPQETTIYKMEVVSPDGCTASDEVEIEVTVVEKLDVTTLFSPNGDGMNDTWVVNKPELIKGCRLVIFNRNGTEVYSTSQYNNEWDATINGTLLPEGTYYYVFDCSDGRTMNGPITVLRERR